MAKKTIQDEINAFLESWDCEQTQSFMRDIIPLVELYNVDEEDDWVEDKVGKEDVQHIRLIRTVYLVSKIAEFHAPKLCSINIYFKNLWKKMEKHSIETEKTD